MCTVIWEIRNYYSYVLLMYVGKMSRSHWSLDLHSIRPNMCPFNFHSYFGLGKIRLSFCIDKSIRYYIKERVPYP
jgi:hypothetical protein